MRHFRSTRDGVKVSLTDEERVFLGDVIPLLAGVGSQGDDSAAERLRVPVYLDDPEANDEWWRLMGEDLQAARKADRNVFSKVIEAGDPVTITGEEADAFLRVLNEARLVLGARLGIEVEEDYESLPEESRDVMGYLGFLLEELTVELSRSI